MDAIEAFENRDGLTSYQRQLVYAVMAGFRSACPETKQQAYETFYSHVATLVKAYDAHRTEQIAHLERLLTDALNTRPGFSLVVPAL